MGLSLEWLCPGPPGMGGTIWCFYDSYKLLVTIPAVIASIIVGTRTWRKRRRLNKQDPRRTRTLADFFDKLVIILFTIDAIGSIPEFFYVFDTQAYPLRYFEVHRHMPVNTILYVELLEGQIMLNAVWHCYMSWVMFSFIGMRKSVARLKREAHPKKVLGACVVAMVLYAVMWVLLWHDAVRRGTFGHIPKVALGFDLTVFPLTILFMLAMYFLTWRALKGRSTEAAFLTGRYVRIRRKLMLITIIVPTALFLGMLGDVGQWMHHIRNTSPTSEVVFVLIRITMFRMVGLLDALIFGGAFDSCLDRATDRRDSTASAARLHDKQQGVSSQGEHSTSFHLPQPPPGAASPPHDASGGIALSAAVASRGDRDGSRPSSVDYPEAGPSLLGPPTLNIHVGAQPFGAASGLAHQHSYLHPTEGPAPPTLPPAMAMDAVSELTDPGLLAPLPPGSSVMTGGGASAAVGGPPGGMRGRVRIFATTYNVGDVHDLAALGNLREWVPPGYDLYVFGFQECLILEPLRAAVHAVLGKRAFDMFTREIGDTTILNGMIALTIFARSSDVDRGAVQVSRSALGKLHSGMKLGPVRAPNKGMVGISLRYHDVSIACMSAHYAADKHGKSGLRRRNQDASRTLRELSLTYDDEEFDTHLAHDVSILLGDLNYRLTAPAPEILRLVSQAAAIEDDKWRKRRQALLQGPAPAPSSKNWREGRYRRLFFFDAAEGAPSCFPSPSPASPMPFAAAGEEGVSRGTIPRNSSFYRPAPLLAPQHSIKEGSNEEEDEAGHSSSYNTSGHNGTHAAAAPAAAAGAAEEEVNPPPPHVPLPAPHERSTDSGIGGGRLSSAVSSSIATTPRSSQQPPGAGGLAGGAAGGLLKKYTSLTTAATVDLEVKPHKPWGWVRKCDELSLSMRKGHTLYNFHEGPLLFPPSFRWIPGKVGGDFKDPAALEECFTLRVHSTKSGWSERPPSYTDRILFHALPDVSPRLAIMGYEMCDAMTGSDHRPVSCRLEVEVNTTVIGFNTLSPEEAAAAATAAATAAAAFAAEEVDSGHAHEQEGGPVEVLVLGGDRPAKEEQAGSDDAPIDIRVVAPPPADDDSAATAPSAGEGTHRQGLGHERRRSRSLEEAALRFPAPLPPQSGSAAPSPAKPHSKGSIPSSSSSASLSGRFARVLSRGSGGGHAVAPEEGGSIRSLASLGRQLSHNSGASGGGTMTRAGTQGSSHGAGGYRGPLAVWTLELTHMRLIGHEVDLPDVDEVTVLFPVSVEDPLAQDRKSIALDESFFSQGQRSAPISGALAAFLQHHQHQHAAKALHHQYQQDTHRSDPTVSTTHSCGAAASAPRPAMDVVQNVHRISYRRMAQMRDQEGGARGLATTVSAVVAPGFTRHLLIKLLDPKGRGIGQGVISLRDAAALGPEQDLVVPLSLGGEPQLVHLSLRVALREDLGAFVPTAGGLGGGL